MSIGGREYFLWVGQFYFVFIYKLCFILIQSIHKVQKQLMTKIQYIIFNKPKKKKMRTIAVSFSDEQILRIFLIVQTINLLPFLITDLVILSNSDSICLYEHFGDGQHPFAIFFLGQWVFTDGYIKLAVYTSVIFFNLIARELQCKRTLVVVCGTILRLFYIFDFGWTVAASVLFWQKSSGSLNPVYTYCESPFEGYIFFLLIFSYIIIPINLFVCGFRSNQSTNLPNPQVVDRRTTQLVDKEKESEKTRQV